MHQAQKCRSINSTLNQPLGPKNQADGVTKKRKRSSSPSSSAQTTKTRPKSSSKGQMHISLHPTDRTKLFRVAKRLKKKHKSGPVDFNGYVTSAPDSDQLLESEEEDDDFEEHPSTCKFENKAMLCLWKLSKKKQLLHF